MKGLVAFDSYYGNGAQVAVAIAEELRAADDARAAARRSRPGSDTGPS